METGENFGMCMNYRFYCTNGEFGGKQQIYFYTSSFCSSFVFVFFVFINSLSYPIQAVFSVFPR